MKNDSITFITTIDPAYDLPVNVIYYIKDNRHSWLDDYVEKRARDIVGTINMNPLRAIDYKLQVIEFPESISEEELSKVLRKHQLVMDFDNGNTDFLMELRVRNTSAFLDGIAFACRIIPHCSKEWDDYQFCLLSDTDITDEVSFQMQFNLYMEKLFCKNLEVIRNIQKTHGMVTLPAPKDIEGRIVDEAIDIKRLLDNETKIRLERMVIDMQALTEISGMDFLSSTLLERGLFKLLPNKKKEIKLSHLTVDDEFRIILNDYDDLEIKLDTLAKVLYILFLLHPEGLSYPEIPDYKEELMDIYLKVASDGRDLDLMEKSIDLLCDPIDGSCREKLSRIKRVFMNSIPEEAARFYIPDGPRGGKRKINLPDGYVSLCERL